MRGGAIVPTPRHILQRIEQNRTQHSKILDLRGQNLLAVPPEVLTLDYLEELWLDNNAIRVVPADLNVLPRLRIIDLRQNPLREIADIPDLVLDWGTWQRHRDRLAPEHIAGLWLRWHADDLIEELLRLPRLCWLDLSFNRLTEIPKSISRLQNLTSLNLNDNRLTEIPESISRPQNLISLNLGGNQLTALPKWLSRLQNLSSLNLGVNQLTKLPESISRLQNLTSLDLNNNRLTKLPESITQLQNLRNLFLKDNPIQQPPLESLDLEGYLGNANLKKLHAYFRQRAEQGVDRLYEAKLLIVGVGGAGKTSLARKILDAAAALPGEDDSTKGIKVAPWSFPLDKNRMFRVNIWDFGGQVIYQSTHQFFLTKRSLYVLVADTRRDDTDFYWWLNTVELLSDNSPLFIVKNEKDNRFFQLNEGALRGRFANLKEVLSANFANNRGLDQILDAIRYHVSHLPHVGTALPKFWVKVRAALENNRETILLWTNTWTSVNSRVLSVMKICCN